MRILTLMILSIFIMFFSCKKTNKPKEFRLNSLYFSCNNQDNGTVSSIHINDKYEVDIEQESMYDDSKVFIYCQLDEFEIHDLGSLLVDLKKENIFTDIDEQGLVTDASSFSLLVYYNEQDSIRAEIIDRSFKDDEKSVSDVCIYLYWLIDKKIRKMNTKNFKTKSKDFEVLLVDPCDSAFLK